jgi:hypothetical protein
MTDVAYIVRCQRCGVARKSYNDPRRGISVIECKRPCGNSHYEWTLVRVIPAAEVWPPETPEESDIPIYVLPPRSSTRAAIRDQSPSPTHMSAEQSKEAADTIQFTSQGKGSVVRSRATPVVGEVAQQAVSTSVPADEQSKKEKRDCIVQ